MLLSQWVTELHKPRAAVTCVDNNLRSFSYLLIVMFSKKYIQVVTMVIPASRDNHKLLQRYKASS